MEPSPYWKANSSSAILKIHCITISKTARSRIHPILRHCVGILVIWNVGGIWTLEGMHCLHTEEPNVSLETSAHTHTTSDAAVTAKFIFDYGKFFLDPIPSLEDRPFQTPYDYFISLFKATLHICRLSPEFKNQRTYCVIVTRGPLTTDVLGLMNY
jgi:hypothetical protein